MDQYFHERLWKIQEKLISQILKLAQDGDKMTARLMRFLVRALMKL